MFKKKSLTLVMAGITIWAIVYFGLASWYLTKIKVHEVQQVKNHATIIAHDLWNLNNYGIQAYLDLVTETDHYSILEIFTNNEENFLKITGPEQSTIDKILSRIGLITVEQISFPVIYEKQEIGVFQGERYIRYVYPLFYIFLGLIFLILTLIFIFYLIFNRRILAHQVQERTQKFQELVNLLPEMVIDTDAAGFITFANDKAQKCLGIHDFTEKKHDCRKFIRLENGERGDQSIYLGSEGPDLKRKDYKVKSVHRGLFPVLVRSAPIYRGNVFVGARMVIIDVTERKALEEQLTRDQKMKSIGIMAGGVAHDLNNILSGIINYPELLLYELPKDSPLIELVIPMKDAGLRAAAVVADLLTVARGVAATRELANLNDIILDYTHSPEFQNLQSLYPKLSYTRHLSPDLGNIYCSIIHVRKSLMNLVNNASEAVDDRGKVTIETTTRTIETPTTTGHGIITPGSYVVVSVSDSGKGIPASELSHILEPFFSKKELGRSGTGLGLTIVWNTMQDHDGGIQVISTAKGSTFELYFRSSSDGLEVADTRKSNIIPTGHGQKILIVDDEFQQRDIATRLLESLGYNVESVATGMAAVDYVRENPVDLVLLDMVLESELNGLETYEKIKKICPEQKAIIISGFSESDDVKNTIHLGAGELVNKPYTKEQLAKSVCKELAKD